MTAVAAITLSGISLAFGRYVVDALTLGALLFGLAIVGGTFLLSSAAEVLQLDVSPGFALGPLALSAILPEYIVDATFAWKATAEPAYDKYAVANMTGASRILNGAAWPLVVLLGWLRWRRTEVELEPGHGQFRAVLLVATLYAMGIPLKRAISLLDLAVLDGLFARHTWRLARLPTVQRRLATAGLAVAAAIAAAGHTGWRRRCPMAPGELYREGGRTRERSRTTRGISRCAASAASSRAASGWAWRIAAKNCCVPTSPS